MKKPAESSREESAAPKGATTTDEGLVCAFNELRTELVSTLYFFLGNHADAQDAVQDTFLKCWRSRDRLEGVISLRAWIFRVGLNAARDLQRNAWRRKARSMVGANHMVGSSPAPPAIAEEREQRDRLRKAISDLRPEEKEVYLLRQNGDLTYEEIAVLRQAPVGTVKTQMRAALAKLRQALKEKAVEE